MRPLYLLIICILTTSCATVFNKRSYPVIVTSNERSAKIEIKKDTFDLPAKVMVKRSKKDLNINLLRSDTLFKSFVVKASPDKVTLLGNLGWFQLYPAALLIDYISSKGMYYGKYITLYTEDNTNVIMPPVLKSFHTYFKKRFSERKGTVSLLLSLPHINNFYQNPEGKGLKRNTGFGGISAGVEYFYQDKKSMTLRFSATTDMLPPVPASPNYDGYYEVLNSSFISLSDNFKFGRISIGYGIHYSLNTWELNYDGFYDNTLPKVKEEKKTNKSLGVNVSFYHQFTDHFLVGARYLPSIFTLNHGSSINYEHLITIDFKFKIPLISN